MATHFSGTHIQYIRSSLNPRASKMITAKTRAQLVNPDALSSFDHRIAVRDLVIPVMNDNDTYHNTVYEAWPLLNHIKIQKCDVQKHFENSLVVAQLEDSERGRYKAKIGEDMLRQRGILLRDKLSHTAHVALVNPPSFSHTVVWGMPPKNTSFQYTTVAIPNTDQHGIIHP